MPSNKPSLLKYIRKLLRGRGAVYRCLSFVEFTFDSIANIIFVSVGLVLIVNLPLVNFIAFAKVYGKFPCLCTENQPIVFDFSHRPTAGGQACRGSRVDPKNVF